MTRRGVAQGAEKVQTKSDYLPVIRGGNQVEHILKIHPSGNWPARIRDDNP